MSTSYVDTSEGNQIMKGFENKKWLGLLSDHRGYLLRNATTFIIDQHVFEQEQKRPLVVLRRSNIPKDIAMEVLFINDISLTDGFRDDQTTIKIPLTKDIEYLDGIFIAKSS
jgi:hypothetical protein